MIIWHYFLKPSLMSDEGILEITQAPLWADLQAIEFQHRTMKNLQIPVLLKGAVGSGKYDVLGLQSESAQFPFVWILLNTNAGVNGIYAMPGDVGFVLPCGYLRELEMKEQIDAHVHQALQSHCGRLTQGKDAAS